MMGSTTRSLEIHYARFIVILRLHLRRSALTAMVVNPAVTMAGYKAVQIVIGQEDIPEIVVLVGELSQAMTTFVPAHRSMASAAERPVAAIRPVLMPC